MLIHDVDIGFAVGLNPYINVVHSQGYRFGNIADALLNFSHLAQMIHCMINEFVVRT